jgi:Fic family protein
MKTPTLPPAPLLEHPKEAHQVAEIQARLQKYVALLNQDNPMQNTNIDLNQIFPLPEKLEGMLSQIDELKKCLDSFRPLNSSETANLAEAFDLEYTYESNRIEGNSLSLRETQVVLEFGVTIGGKPLAHHLEAINHRDALKFIKRIVNEKQTLTPSVLLDVNRIILRSSEYEEESGRYRQSRVRIKGSNHIPPNFAAVPEKMNELFTQFEDWKASGVHPVKIAADLHFHIVRIHPFIDGNGRTSRLIMNLWLLLNGYTIANLSGSDIDRLRYYDALEEASMNGNLELFQKLIYERERASLIWHLDLLTPNVDKGRGIYFLEKLDAFLPRDEA